MPHPPLPQPVVISRASRPPRHPPLSAAEHEQWKLLMAAASQACLTPKKNPWIPKLAAREPSPVRSQKAFVPTPRPPSAKVEATLTSPRIPSRNVEEIVAGSDRKARRSRCNVRTLSIIAPGGGTGANGRVFEQLSRSGKFHVEIVGHSRASYDRYPESWPQGCSPPNLCSFAQEVVTAEALKSTDCLIVGSRGGQVVLPELWNALGSSVPPTIIINGGCAMKLPDAFIWPIDAVSFLLLGGQDHFRQKSSPEEYVNNTQRHVPRSNRTTAILYINEMLHMPQGDLLSAILLHMISASLSWKSSSRETPVRELQALLSTLTSFGDIWTGRLLWTSRPGQWEEVSFGAPPTLLGHLSHRRRSAAVAPEKQCFLSNIT